MYFKIFCIYFYDSSLAEASGNDLGRLAIPTKHVEDKESVSVGISPALMPRDTSLDHPRTIEQQTRSQSEHLDNKYGSDNMPELVGPDALMKLSLKSHGII